MQLSLCSNIYDDVTDFEICGFYKNRKSRYQQKQIFFQVKNSLITHQGGCFMAKKKCWLRIVLSYVYTGLVLLPMSTFGAHTDPPRINHLQKPQL